MQKKPRALHSHCCGHALNLAASDTIKKNKILCDVLDTVFKITKLLKFSPKRDALFDELKQEITPGTPGFAHYVLHNGQFDLYLRIVF